MQKKKIVFILNPRAGTGKCRNLCKILNKCLDLQQFEYAIYPTQYRGHGEILAAQAIDNQVDIVVAVGGDGTINEIARKLVNSNTALGIIPVGSGNGLAHHLKISSNVKKAVKIIQQASPQLIDVLSVNDKICISIAGMGFDAQVAELFDKSAKRGFFTYFSCILRAFFQYSTQTYIVEREGIKPIEYKNILLACIANSSQWGFNVKLVPQASLQDGLADICLLEKPSFGQLGLRVIRLFSGNLYKDKSATHLFQTAECTLKVKNQQTISTHIDGDPIEKCNSMKIKVLEKQLKILIP
ncbi:MAG: YegS/Rv2252/BmrU family lipid kinase [Bacteroidales bacterium]|jgi:YegS/Rv2252/BmrU family lipid kinase|nr:YegS/Rv2252/BmrU family lipid kinase [Bacteroidales bacterium]